jgi:UDPglucose--hexose-1-phosphate uridylyltransferase
MSKQSLTTDFSANGKASLLLDYAAAEVRNGARVVHHSGHFLALVPYWATWPFETLVLPTHRHIPHIAALTDDERSELAETVRAVACRCATGPPQERSTKTHNSFDNLFECSFPYSMGLYQAPTLNAPEADVAQLHLSFKPPLLRSASVRKFLVGCVRLASP